MEDFIHEKNNVQSICCYDPYPFDQPFRISGSPRRLWRSRRSRRWVGTWFIVVTRDNCSRNTHSPLSLPSLRGATSSCSARTATSIHSSATTSRTCPGLLVLLPESAGLLPVRETVLTPVDEGCTDSTSSERARRLFTAIGYHHSLLTALQKAEHYPPLILLP